MPTSEPDKETTQKTKQSKKRLHRSTTDKMLAGVCGGIAEYLDIDSSLVRLLWLAFTLAGGSGIIAYLICWIIFPED